MSKDLYKQSGVDMETGDHLVDWLIANKSKSDLGNQAGRVLDGIGGFAGLFQPNLSGYQQPVLVASTDGVGTKLLLALEHERLSGIGHDLVGMCVNDLYCIGARPLFFVDYYATGKLDPLQFREILGSIKDALKLCETPLLGGETAELPGLYANKHFDLAGFVVGLVDGQKRLQPKLIEHGDVLYAFSSSGFHSNGYSLIRKWINEFSLYDDQQLIHSLLEPTRIYHFIPALLDKLGCESIHGIANITGGGISGNLPRILPAGFLAEIEFSKLPVSKLFDDLFARCKVKARDLEAVFNLGCGMIAAIAAEKTSEFERAFHSLTNIELTKIGSVKRTSENKVAEVLFL